MSIVKNLSSPTALAFLLFINISVHLVYYKIEGFDLPQSTKKLIVDTVKKELEIEANQGCKKEIRNLENVVDEISYASQLGRLDTISLLLTIFGLILGFGAIAGFMHIKETSQLIARSEAKKWLDSEAGKKELQQMLTEKFNAFEKSAYLADKSSGQEMANAVKNEE